MISHEELKKIWGRKRRANVILDQDQDDIFNPTHIPPLRRTASIYDKTHKNWKCKLCSEDLGSNCQIVKTYDVNPDGSRGELLLARTEMDECCTELEEHALVGRVTWIRRDLLTSLPDRSGPMDMVSHDGASIYCETVHLWKGEVTCICGNCNYPGLLFPVKFRYRMQWLDDIMYFWPQISHDVVYYIIRSFVRNVEANGFFFKM